MTCGDSCGVVLLQLLAIGLSNGAIIALNAIGVTLVYGAVRMINFAHGDLFALTTVVVTSAISGLGLQRAFPALPLAGGLLAALAIAMAFGVALNVTIERVVFRPFRARSRLAPLIAGIGVSFILFQVVLIWRTVSEVGWGNPEHHSDVDHLGSVPHGSIPDLLPSINLVRAAGIKLGITYTLKDVLVLLLAVALAALVGWLLQRTRIGRALRACAQDPEMAQLCGVNRNGATQLAFAIGGALAGAAAFVFTLYYTRPFGQHGVESGLIAFAAAVLGGVGRPWGAFWSGLLLGVLSALSDYFLAPQWTPVVVLAVLILLLLIRPTGLTSEGDDDTTATTATEVIARGRQRAAPRWLVGALVALALAYPLLDVVLGLHKQPVVNGILVFAMLALGLNVVLGFAGVLDLGFAACFGIGGYITAILTAVGGKLSAFVPQPLDFLVVLVLSGAGAALFGFINGNLTRRMRGDYLAIVTLAVGQIVPRVFLNLDQWTGGARGLSALPAPRVFGYQLGTPTTRYYLALALVLLAVIGSQRLVRSRIGRAWAATSQDEAAATSCGVNPGRAKYLAFSIGAALAGVAGALYVGIFNYIGPDQTDFRVSAMVLAMVVIGGAGSVMGAIGGAILIAGYDQLIIPALSAWVEQLGAANGGWLITVAATMRELTFLSFGLALYLTIWLRARQTPDMSRSDK